jgi:hypothetical protein
VTGKLFIRIAIVLSLCLAVKASALTVEASVDVDEVGIGDPVNLSVTISGAGGSVPDPVLPDLSDFDVYSSGSNRSFSMVNGVISSSLDLNYVLVPKRKGTLTIGPIMVSSKGETAQSDPIKISVKEAGTIPSGPRQQARRPSSRRTRESRDFFIEQSVDKKRPYVGEQVTLSFRFYQAVNLWDQPNLEWPEYTGFTVEDLPPNSRSYQIVNGKKYLVTEIKRALFPIAPGKVTIETPRLTIKPDDFGGARDPFNLLGRDFFRRGSPRVLTTNPVVLDVRSLPDRGRPADFSGAVGRYVISADVDRDSAGVDEPVTLKIVLSGTGNIKSLPPLEVPELADFRVYESGKTESINSGNYVISGKKTFEMALIPKTSGSFTIPAFHYSFFDPGRGRYETMQTRPIEIEATGEGLVDVGGAPRYIIEADHKAFNYIITSFPEPASNIDLYSRPWFWIIQFIPLIGIIAALGMRSHYKKMLGDRSYARRIRAARRSKSVFKSALAKKESGEYAGFCGDLHDAIMGFVADRLDLEKSGLTIDDIQGLGRIPGEIREDLSNFLEECQTARFAPLNFDGFKADEMLSRAHDVIGRLEKAL